MVILTLSEVSSPPRMRTQTAAGCCSVRRIWSPCSPSSHSSSSIHTCWEWASRVGEPVCPSFCLLVCLIHCMNWHTSFRPGVYEPVSCSSQKIMRVFGFASSLIEILALGLQTYNRARYRQLVKRIGHIIRSVQQSESTQLWIQYIIIENHNIVFCFFLRMTVCYVSDHWAQYVSLTGAGGSGSHSLSLEKLQLEYDHLFLRAVLHVLRNKRWSLQFPF